MGKLEGEHVSRGGKDGVCHVCGKQGKMSFEHIPPKSMGNIHNAKLYNAVEIIAEKKSLDLTDKNGFKYKQQQRGSGFQTLCKECNSFFGANYVEAFTGCIMEFAKIPHSSLVEDGAKGIHLEAHKINVLAFVKQVIANFCAVTNPGSMVDCKRFLLEKESNAFPERLKLFMFAVPDETEGLVSTGWTKLITSKDLRNGFRVASLAYFPVGFYLLDQAASSVEPNINLGCDITPMAAVPWDDKPRFSIDLPYMTISQGIPHPISSGK